MQVTRKEKIRAVEGMVQLYKDAEWFKKKKVKVKKVYDEIEPWKLKNMEGYIGFLKDKPDKAYFNTCGSNDPKDWKYNYKFFSKRMDIKGNPYELISPYDGMQDHSKIKAHRGFLLCYKESKLRDFTLETATKYKEIEFIGHSLGASMAILQALDVQKNRIIDSKDITCFPFSAPRVFNEAGVESYNRRVSRTYLYWYCNDMVVKNLFQWLVGQRHIDHWNEYQVGKPFMLLPWNWILAITGWPLDHYPTEVEKQMIKELKD